MNSFVTIKSQGYAKYIFFAAAQQSVKALFYFKMNVPKKNGNVPVMCRVTVDGTIA